jgi:trehalose synthase
LGWWSVVSRVDDYKAIVGENEMNDLQLLADRLKGKSVVNINSTPVGGGVAEILTRMVPLLKDLGVNARWDVIKGNEQFFTITKNVHNALHGMDQEVTEKDWNYFLEVNRGNAEELDLSADIVFIHDPQPVALVEKKKENKWLWRCHIDLSNPQPGVYGFLEPFLQRYDASVFSAPAFGRRDLKIRQVLISPSIDPLSDKNKELPQSTIDKVLDHFHIDRNRPIVTQISRFDTLKDPSGVIKVYKKVKRHSDCQLILAGGGAADDPEGLRVLESINKAGEEDPDIHVLYSSSDIEVNALQRASTVILQKSLREGFGLTVTEALWKSRPVIASAVGGIPLQISHRHSGILSYSIAGTAVYLQELLNNPEYAQMLGKNGHEEVKENFLLTRHVKDYLLLFLSLYRSEDLVYL